MLFNETLLYFAVTSPFASISPVTVFAVIYVPASKSPVTEILPPTEVRVTPYAVASSLPSTLISPSSAVRSTLCPALTCAGTSWLFSSTYAMFRFPVPPVVTFKFSPAVILPMRLTLPLLLSTRIVGPADMLFWTPPIKIFPLLVSTTISFPAVILPSKIILPSALSRILAYTSPPALTSPLTVISPFFAYNFVSSSESSVPLIVILP